VLGNAIGKAMLYHIAFPQHHKNYFNDQAALFGQSN
jgi:hypothetical protein